MAYLEESEIVHGDLSARNLLVDKMNNVKVADFGLSRSAADKVSPDQSNRGKFPVRW